MAKFNQVVLFDEHTEQMKVYTGWRIMPALFAQFLKNIREAEGIGYIDEYTFQKLFDRAKQMAKQASKEYESYATIENITVEEVFIEKDGLKARLIFKNVLGSEYPVEMTII